VRLVPDDPPRGPFRPGFWRSPLRGPWLTSLLGSLLLVLVSVVAVTGFVSQAAYQPGLGTNQKVPGSPGFAPFAFDWPTHPSWLYAANQGLHVTVGIVAVPLLLAKLWSVIPRLFAWPPLRSPAMAIERLSIALLVGSALFQFATGIADVQVWYPFGFGFVTAHYYGAWVFVGSLALHVAVKLPTMRRTFATQGVIAPLKADLARTRPEPPDPDGLVASAPAEPTLSRRGLLGLVGGGSLLLLGVTAGQTVGGPLRATALLAPRGRRTGGGANDFQVNKTATGSHVTPEMTGPGYRLELRGGAHAHSLSRSELLRLELRTADLPIACVEGWSTTQRWTGVTLAELARMAGAPARATVHVESLQPAGAFREVTLSPDQVADPRSLLALHVNGADLSVDHGFPARLVVPALPGVHNTKWVSRLTFAAAA